MDTIVDTKILTHRGALQMLSAATAAAEASGQPQCIVIVDARGQVAAEIVMTGSRFLSRKSAKSKALTAAATGRPSADVPEAMRQPLGAATGGLVTGLPGGLPIIIDGVLLGGVGVGSGTGPQDIEVAQAALAAIGADL